MIVVVVVGNVTLRNQPLSIHTYIYIVGFIKGKQLKFSKVVNDIALY